MQEKVRFLHLWVCVCVHTVVHDAICVSVHVKNDMQAKVTVVSQFLTCIIYIKSIFVE